MTAAVNMPENPAELRQFVQGVVDVRMMELWKDNTEQLRQLAAGQARVEGRVDELATAVRLYREDSQGLREDFRSLLERFDSFQVEMRREHEVLRQELKSENETFRRELRVENETFRRELRAENETFRREVRLENEKFHRELCAENETFHKQLYAENETFRQQVEGQFEGIAQQFERVDERFDKIDERFEKIDERFEKIDQRFERMELRLYDMQKSITVQTKWLLALLLAVPVIYSVADRVLLKLIP